MTGVGIEVALVYEIKMQGDSNRVSYLLGVIPKIKAKTAKTYEALIDQHHNLHICRNRISMGVL